MSTEVEISESVAAGIAAHAASTVRGVVRLEPGIGGFMTDLAVRARHQLGPGEAISPAPREGVEVTVKGATAYVQVDVAVDTGERAASVAHAVQIAIAESLLANAALIVARVTVSILDIEVFEDGHSS